MSPRGKCTIFVYIKSTYIELERDHGGYCESGWKRLDTRGTEFDDPKHPCFDDFNVKKEAPELTPEEQTILFEIHNNSNLSSDKEEYNPR